MWSHGPLDDPVRSSSLVSRELASWTPCCESLLIFLGLVTKVFPPHLLSSSIYSKVLIKKEPKLRFYHFYPSKIKTPISKLDLTKALSLDHISKALLSNLVDSFGKSLRLIFNLNASKAVFPAKWKVTIKVLIFKQRNEQNASICRPNSILSGVSNLLEKLFFDKVSPVIHSRLSPIQHGLRTKRSTISNLIEFFNHLYYEIDSPNCSKITAFYNDFQKSFDKVSNQRILEKLSNFSAGHNCLNLRKSRLEQQRQTVKVNDQLSSELPVLSGVPRRSLLGSLCFLVYINDLPDIIVSTNFGYADELKVNGENAVTMEIDVRLICEWCSGNFMSMNPAKSKYVAIKGCATVSLSK